MFGFLKARRACKAAVALIGPFVEASRRRFPVISQEAWFDPYMVGFMGMLISLAAERAAGRLDSQSVGLVQLEAWQQITGCHTELIGEEICLLSSSNDRMFIYGCQNARRFIAALTRPAAPDHPDSFPPGHRIHGIDFDFGHAMGIWSECFEAHLGASRLASGCA